MRSIWSFVALVVLGSTAADASALGADATRHRSSADDDDRDSVYADDENDNADEDDGDDDDGNAVTSGDVDGDEPEAAPQMPKRIAPRISRQAPPRRSHRASLLAPRHARQSVARRAPRRLQRPAQPSALKASTDPALVNSAPTHMALLSGPFGNDPSRFGMYDFSHTADSGSVSLLTPDQARHEDIESVATHEQATENSGNLLQTDDDGDSDDEDDVAGGNQDAGNGGSAGMMESVITSRDTGSVGASNDEDEPQWG